jgi:DNA-binding response OmpR family regulator
VFTLREFAMLLAFASRAGRPVSHDWLHRAVWGVPVQGFKDRSVEVYVVKLRRKLVRPATPTPTSTLITGWVIASSRFQRSDR